MEAFNVSARFHVSIGAWECDAIISLVKAACTIASSYVSDGINGEQVRPPAKVDLFLAPLPTGGIKLGQEASDLVDDLELPVLYIARCEGVGQETAFSSVLVLVDNIKEIRMCSSGQVVYSSFAAWRCVAVDGAYRARRGEGQGVWPSANNRMLLMDKMEGTGTKATAAFIDVAEPGDA